MQGKKAALAVKAIYCDCYSHSKLLLLIQMKIMQMPYDIAGITHIFQKLFVIVVLVFMFSTTKKKKNTRTRNFNAITEL